MSAYKIVYQSANFNVYIGKPGLMVHSRKTNKEVNLKRNAPYFDLYADIFAHPVSDKQREAAASKLLG